MAVLIEKSGELRRLIWSHDGDRLVLDDTRPTRARQSLHIKQVIAEGLADYESTTRLGHSESAVS